MGPRSLICLVKIFSTNYGIQNNVCTHLQNGRLNKLKTLNFVSEIAVTDTCEVVTAVCMWAYYIFVFCWDWGLIQFNWLWKKCGSFKSLRANRERFEQHPQNSSYSIAGSVHHMLATLCIYRNCLRLQRPRIGFCVRESRKPGRLESKRQRRNQTQTHTSDVLRTPDLRARENFRTDKVSGRTGKGAACLCTRHVRKPGQGICVLQTL